jgi:hypothetical protein
MTDAAKMVAENPNEAEIAASAVTAANNEPDPAKKQQAAADAIEETSKDKGMPIDKATAQMIARMVVDDIEERGGFDSPNEPVAAPAPPATAAAAPPAGQPAVQAPQADQLPQAPVKKTWAERFRKTA